MEREAHTGDAPVIVTHDLTRVFGDYTAVDHLNLSVPRVPLRIVRAPTMRAV